METIKNKSTNTYPHIIKEIERERNEQIKKYPQTEKTTLKYYKKVFEKLEEVANAPELEAAEIATEWKISRVWGYCPTVTAKAWTIDENGERAFTTTGGRASGCGYDKESAAIAEALNKNPAFLKVLFNAEEKRLKGLKTRKISRRDFIGYGSGVSAKPYFEGACGVSVFYRIFENCGYKFEAVAAGKTCTAYTIKQQKGAKK